MLENKCNYYEVSAHDFFSLINLLDKTYSNISGFQSPKLVHFFSFGESDNILQVRCQ